MAFSIMFTIEDGKGKTSTTEVNLPATVAFTDVSLFAAELAKVINIVITGRITRIGACFSVPLPGTLRPAPDPLSDVEEGARFQFETSAGFFSGLRLPTFDESLIIAGTSEVDISQAPGATFVNSMVQGINLTGVGGSGNVEPCDKRGDDLVGTKFAREQFLSSRGRS